MIKVNSLFKNVNLQNLSKEAKLFYIYLITNPEINILGVCSLNINITTIQLNLSVDELRKASKELIDNKLLKVFIDNTDSIIHFLVLKHYQTQPKGHQTVKKAKQALDNISGEVKEYISENFELGSKNSLFIEPTEKEIEDFAMSCGYSISGKTVIEYYRGRAEFNGKKNGWYDGRGKQVIDWKRKVRNVWCKESNKLKKSEDAPKNLEYFHVLINNKQVYPDYWKDDKPYSRKGIIETTELQQEYERQRNSL